jgi:predicted transcriptional regulator
MKTAISIPDDVFRAIDSRARSLKLSRSALLTRAAREFLARNDSGALSATEAWNKAIERAGQPMLDPAAAAFQRRTRAVVRKCAKG